MYFSYVQDQTDHAMVFLMISSSDHISPATGITPVVTISKNGGAFATPVGAVSEIGSGWYKVAPAAADFDTTGPLVLHATGSGADPTDSAFEVWSGLVDLGPSQTTTIIGNIQGAVGSVTNPVTCTTSSTTTTCTCCCRPRCC